MRKQARSQRKRLVPPRRPRSGKAKPAVNKLEAGISAGYEEGVRAGMEGYGHYFEGTSIIIPSYNQVDYLAKCIASIQAYTSGAYEIIVVDNASADGTGDYLQGVGGVVRYRLLEHNRGFAGAINVGMMMAKGTHLLLLNNDTIVTERWLDNLLACLLSDPAIGMVGPVTNYISGEQRIAVPYTEERDIAAFARGYNVSDKAKWQPTDRLTGFCLLFRRELWDRTGYLDEGFKIGNFEDDDYNIRVRLQGRALVIARDTFIHHFGSVSMRALGDKLAEVNDRNEQVYSDKWGNPHDLIAHVKALGADIPERRSETSFFPERVVVRGIADAAFWVEGGIRRPICGPISVPVSRLSLVDLRRWPIGEPIDAALAEANWQSQAPLWEEGGGLYIAENGCRRRVPSERIADAWSLRLRIGAQLTNEQRAGLREGLPVIAPVQVADHL